MFLEARCLGISWRRNSRSSAPGNSMGHSGKQTIFPLSRSSDSVSGLSPSSWALVYVASMAQILSAIGAKSRPESGKRESAEEHNPSGPPRFSPEYGRFADFPPPLVPDAPGVLEVEAGAAGPPAARASFGSARGDQRPQRREQLRGARLH